MMKNNLRKFTTAILLLLGMVVMSGFASCDSDEPEGGESGKSNASVVIESISIGSKDKAGRYTVKITVKAKGLANNESVKTIGAKWGTSKSNQNSRDTRSGTSSATFTSAWHSSSTYYVTPILKTNLTGSEITGTTKTKKTP